MHSNNKKKAKFEEDIIENNPQHQTARTIQRVELQDLSYQLKGYVRDLRYNLAFDMFKKQIEVHHHKELIIIALFYNMSDSKQDQFIKYFRELEYSPNNQIIQNSFEQIKKLCGAKFDIIKIEPLINPEYSLNINSELTSSQYYYSQSLYQKLTSYISQNIFKHIDMFIELSSNTIISAVDNKEQNQDLESLMIKYMQSLLDPGLQHQNFDITSNHTLKSETWRHLSNKSDNGPPTPRFKS
jgi:hypothetical protein